MTAGIPIDQIVEVDPSVVGTGGNPLSMNGVILTESLYAPTSSLLSFSGTDTDSVGAYFGVNSDEYKAALIYAAGPTKATKKPYFLFFAGYAATARAAWLRGSSLAGMTLTQLQAISGTLSVTIDGTAHSGSINLATATSFTNAAATITTDLSLTGAAVTWDASTNRFVVTSGTTGATSTMTQCTGTAAAALGLSAGTLSQGADADTPAGAMARIKSQGVNWVTFGTMFEPVAADKEAFSAWASSQTYKKLYVAYDTDAGYLTANNSATFGDYVRTNTLDGTLVIYAATNTYKAMAAALSWAACIDWEANEGRMTLAFTTFSGLAPEAALSTETAANAVLSNNASYYGKYTAPGDSNDYNIFYDGRMKGSIFLWADTFINQIRLNSRLQLAIFNGLQAVNTAPYNELGRTYIRSWCADPIQEALTNGSIRAGVELSTSQQQTINAQAGFKISDQVQNVGYYLYVGVASASTRGARQSPPVKLWYADGGSIQQITVDSIVAE